MSERIVILGATGFIGRALQAHLTAAGEAEVAGFSSATLDLTRVDLSNVLDAGGKAEHTTLVFASALTPDKGQDIRTLKLNLAMVATVARYLETHRLRHCVYVSSDAVYGFDTNPVTEATPIAPAGYYGMAKYTGEKVMEYASRSNKVPLLSLRLAGVFGPGDSHSAYGPNAFARSLAKSRTVRLFGNGEEERDHIYIDDAVRLMTSLIRSEATGVLTVATGEHRSFIEIVKMIRDLVPHEITIESVPRKGAITHRWYDTARLKRDAPDFRFTPFDEALRRTLVAFGAL
jgi:nucleoside-diphosphate-sugar epimerase